MMRPSHRVLGELLLIVIGVLIALSADAWLDGLTDRRSEGTNLATLRLDLLEVLDELDNSRVLNDQVVSSLKYLLERDLSQEPTDSIARWTYLGVVRSGAFDVPLSGLRAIEEAGQVELFSVDLQLALSDFQATLDNVLKGDRELLGLQETLMIPYGVKQPGFGSQVIMSEDLDVHLRYESPDGLNVFESPEGRNIAVLKIELIEALQPSRQQLREQVTQLIEQIDVTLGSR